jgi:hypothetical protein
MAKGYFMNRSTFLKLKAVISLVFSIALILLPLPLMSIFGVPLTGSGVFVARLFGVDMLGIGFVCWFIRKATDQLVTDIILGLFVADAIGSIVMLAGQLSGMMNMLGWINVGVWLFLTLGLGYFSFVKTSVQGVDLIGPAR